MARKKTSPGNDAWYAMGGQMQDVVVSSKVELHRNLANFPFSPKLHDSESERIQSIVFDAFNLMNDAGSYQIVPVDKLDDVGKKIMQERGILDEYEGRNAGIILRNDGIISCTVNTDDHVVVSSFLSGLGIDELTRNVYLIDCELQKHVQFAASYDFGYLTRFLLNSGSGLGLSVNLHLPACSLMQNVGEIAEKVSREGFVLSERYGSGGNENLSGYGSYGSALGAYYKLTTKSSASGTEVEQMASMQIAVQNLSKEERSARKKCRSDHVTEIANYSYRALALAKASFFINLREAVDIISGIKFGVDMGIIEGIDDTELHALLYRIQEGHLEYVLNSGKFKFEKDIQDNRKKQIERLRALILQESFEKIDR